MDEASVDLNGNNYNQVYYKRKRTLFNLFSVDRLRSRRTT